ncbi:MAG TPA: Ig-like domain-containing protein [Gemmatimonadales bacterium]|nr:Ig-like domain-containing protein [Gemmatimonadales bacterium]
MGAGLASILSSSDQIKAKLDSDGLAPGFTTTVRWIGISPAVDTATSIGDSIQLAVTATDARGNALLGAPTVWSSSDTMVASVDSSGMVVTRGPGGTAVMVSIGDKSVKARIYVVQRPAGLRVTDSLFRLPEGDQGRPGAHLVDVRGHEIKGSTTRWRSADPSIAMVDSAGNAVAIAPGRTTFTASWDGMVGQLPVEVYAVPSSLTVLSGDDQRAPAGRRVTQPVTVQVVSRSGRPISGVPVRFLLEEGAGKAEPVADTSDTKGMARVLWTLGGLPGRQVLTVTAEGVASPAVVTAEAEPVAANTRITVLNETLEGPAGGTLPEPVGVRVTDTSGVALVDVPVAWSAGDDGAVLASESRTDSLGEARARWTLGPKSGTQRAYVQVGSPRTVPRFAISAAALPGAAAKATIVGSPKREGSVGRELRPAVVIKVVDRAGNPVEGVPVKLQTASGTVSDSLLSTDSIGRVTVPWTLGRTAGVQQLTAHVEGIERAIEITVRAKAAGPANLTFVTPKPGTANRAVQSLDVDLTDAYGNPVADQPVVFSTKFGTVSPTRVMTDARGRAHTRWTPAPKTGKRSLLAVVKGTDARAAFVLEATDTVAPAKPATEKTASTKPVAGKPAAVKKHKAQRASR